MLGYEAAYSVKQFIKFHINNKTARPKKRKKKKEYNFFWKCITFKTTAPPVEWPKRKHGTPGFSDLIFSNKAPCWNRSYKVHAISFVGILWMIKKMPPN